MATFQVRREASDVRWDQLSPDQQKAAERVVGLLQSFADQPCAPSKPDSRATTAKAERAGAWYLPWVDGVRANPVVLLDGGRGSGKSTVLLTLVHAWSAPWRKPLLPDPLQDKEGLSRVSPHRNNGLVPSDPRFLPLDMIDLQPIPQGTSLLLRVAGAFARVVEQLEASPGRGDLRDGVLRSRERWNQFVEVVASGWEPNVSARKGTLDTEAYALELALAEQRGRDVQTSFRAFIDALLQDLTGKPLDSSSPLFIVSIDDSDMNVPRSVELITLVRTIWHPRVAFLLTGYRDMFLLALRAHFLGEARRPLQRLRTTDRDLDALSEPEKPIQFAEELYNRVIPPHHHCSIRELDPELRLRHPHGRVEPGEPTSPARKAQVTPSVRDLLGRFALPPGYTGPTDTGGSLALYFEEHHAVLRALPDRLRPLEDFRLWLAEDQPERGTAEVAHHLFKSAVEQSALLPNEADQIRQLVAFERNRTELLVYTGQLELRWIHRRLGSLSFVSGVSLDLLLPIDLPQVFVTSRDHELELPTEVVAAFLLVLDLVADGAGSFVGPSPLSRNPPELVRATVDASSVPSTAPLAWPLPAWESPFDMALAIKSWATAWNGGTDFSGDAVLRAYLKAIVDTAESRGPREPDGIEASDWSTRLARLANSVGSRRAEVQRDWARGFAGALLYPEGGLSNRDREELKNWLDRVAYTDEMGKKRSLLDRHRLDRTRIESKTRVLAALFPGKTPVELQVMARAICAELDRLEGGGPSFDQRLKSLRAVVPLGSFLGTFPNDRLERYVDERIELLKRIQPEEALIIEETLAPHGDQVGVCDVALVALWDALRDHHRMPRLKHVLDLGLGLIVQSLFKQRSNVVASVRRGPTGSDARLLLWALHLDVVPPGGRRLPPSLELIYRVAADVEKDENDFVGLDRLSDRTRWPGLELQLAHHQAKVFWPAVGWEAAIDRELLFRAWNHLTASAANTLRKDASDIAAILESLALQYVVAVLEIGRSRKAFTVSWSARKPDVEAWAKAIQGYFQEAADGRRWTAFSSFRDRLALFAAPEAGLNPEAAARILAALEDRLPRRPVLHAFRRALLTSASEAEPTNLNEVLEDIDRAHPDHPFVMMFGPYEPPWPS